MTSTFSISGKHVVNPANLTGKPLLMKSLVTPHDIRRMKTQVFNKLLLPLMSQQWTVFEQNILLVDSIRQKLNNLYDSFKMDDLLVYIEMLQVFDKFAEKLGQINEIERKMEGKGKNSGNEVTAKGQVMSMVYITSMIRLKPEYELYDNILGKPERPKTYIEPILEAIRHMMQSPYADFHCIETDIRNLSLSHLDEKGFGIPA